MKRKLTGAALAASLTPVTAHAHDAFGDLGPFYGGLLHPLVDPAQGLILIALAVLMARQPLHSVKLAYIAIVLGAVLAALIHTAISAPVPGVRIVGIVVTALGLLALAGSRLPAPALIAIAGILAFFAGFSGDVPNGARAAMLSAFGTALGIALLVLLIWAALDWLQVRLGRIAGAVAASWIAAIGVMAAALPTIAL